MGDSSRLLCGYCEFRCYSLWVDSLFSQLREKISSYISQSNSVSVDKEALFTICEPDDIFSGLHSRYLREKFYTETFKYVVNV